MPTSNTMLARHKRPTSAAASLIAIIAAWLLLAPTSMGGQTSYVIINGASMEPGMRQGDLAILKTGQPYEVGAVATYRHPEIGPVIHRIIAREGERFVFQGDNNSFVDAYQPRSDELIGRLWLHLPRAGTLLQILRSPPIFAAIATIVLGTALMAPASHSLRPRRHRAAPATSPQRHDALGLLSGALTACAALALLALALAAVSFTRPTTREAYDDLAYTQSGRFDYAAPAPHGLYDGGTARAGDPIFLAVASTVPVSFSYRFSAEAPTTLSGVARLTAVLGDGAGWRRTFALGETLSFTGRTATVAGSLDLAALRQAITTYEALSGSPRGHYQLDLLPQVEVEGSLAGRALATSFSPPLRFTLDAKALRPVATDGEVALLSETAAALRIQREEPAVLAFGPMRLAITTARRLALAGLEIALVGGLLAGWRLGRALAQDPGATARLRYGHLLVRAEAGRAWTEGAVTLASLEELARLAERLGQPIFVVEDGATPGYYVRDGAAVYTAGPVAAPQAPAEAV